jgi:hypothetical protein
MSTKMKAAQISKAGGDWELVERDIPRDDDKLVAQGSSTVMPLRGDQTSGR